MAHTSEQPKDGAPNSATTGTNAPAASSATRPASQQTPAIATSTSQNSDLEDKEYDPSAEALIDEIDDERTLEEEEALAGDNSTAVQNELDDLKRESEMPIEELLAYYQRMREQEGAQAGEEEEVDEDESEEGEDEEDDEMEDEDEDEVRKKRSASTGVKKHDHVEQQSHEQPLPTGDQSNKQQREPSTTTNQTTPQVNPSLSNSYLLSPPKSSQHNAKLQHAAELKDIPSQDTQTSAVDLDGSQRPQQSKLPQNPQLNQTQIQPAAPPPAVQEQDLNIECIDESAVYLRDKDARPNDQPTARNRHSMTGFLVDSNASGSLLETFLDYDLDDSDDFDKDYSYTDDDDVDDEPDWRRVIHVGPEYQAEVPETLSTYENDLPPYENPDTLVWRCSLYQTKEKLIDYLKRASAIPRRTDLSLSPASVPRISNHDMRLYRERVHDIQGNTGTQIGESNHENALNPHENLRDVYMSQSRKRLKIDSELEQENTMDGINQTYGDASWVDPAFGPTRDENSNSVSQDTRPDTSSGEYIHAEEQLLYLLLQCNYDCEEALRRRRLDPFKYYFAEPMTLWSQEECMNFENGLRTYGKNFHLIRETKVPTRTRAEVVGFYYLWKKSERHDVYTNQYKIDRKRSLTHPGITDYMDKFIEDNESALNTSSTHTPTPTESTLDSNQVSDSHYDPLASSKCREPETQVSLGGTSGLENQLAQPRQTPNERLDGEGPSQENAIYMDGNTAIERHGHGYPT